MRFSFFLLISLLLFSCTNEDEIILKPQISKDVTFNIGHKIIGIHKGNSGTFKKDNQLYFYFFHHIFTNQISIFNTQQRKVDSISVKKYNLKSNPILSVNFINSDTILLRTKHNT